jgi:hypothetical protein
MESQRDLLAISSDLTIYSCYSATGLVRPSATCDPIERGTSCTGCFPSVRWTGAAWPAEGLGARARVASRRREGAAGLRVVGHAREGEVGRSERTRVHNRSPSMTEGPHHISTSPRGKGHRPLAVLCATFRLTDTPKTRMRQETRPNCRIPSDNWPVFPLVRLFLAAYCFLS